MEEEALELVQQNRGRAERAEAPAKLELTVDEALENYVGSLGPSQLLHVFIVTLAWIFDSQNTLITIFSDSQPSSWKCKTHHHGHGCTGGTRNEGDSVCRLKPGTWEWKDGNSSSTIAEWGLICDRKFLAAIPAALFFLGSLLGCAVYGRLADRYLGRKRTLFLSCISGSVTAFLTSFSPNISVYAILRFANGFARSGIGICCLVLSTEAVGCKWRGQVGQYGFFFFIAGFLSLPLIAYHTRSCWRNLYRIISFLPLAYSLLLLPFVSESPRWLLVKGRSSEALDVLKKFARLNGRRLPANLSLLDPSLAKTPNANEAPRGTVKDESLWATKWAAKRMVLVMAAGVGIGFVYYGVQLNIENLDYNLYLSASINALMEIPAIFIGSILLALMHRRLLYSLFAFLAGVSCILCIPFSRKKKGESRGNWLELSIEASGFMAASTAFDVLYIYCIELFPTNVRNFAVSLLRQALMLGASIAPLLVVLGRLSPKLSFLIFGVLSVFSGVLILWLPETRNAPLYETLKQQEEEEKLNPLKDVSNMELPK